MSDICAIYKIEFNATCVSTQSSTKWDMWRRNERSLAFQTSLLKLFIECFQSTSPNDYLLLENDLDFVKKKQRTKSYSPCQPGNFSLFKKSILNEQVRTHQSAKYMMKQTSRFVVLHQIHSKQSDLRLVERHLLECWTHELKRVGTSCPISSQIFNKIFHQIFLWAKTKCSQIFSGISQI